MIKQIPIRGYDRNFSYFIVGDSGFCVVVDPGDVERLEEVMREDGLKLGGILVTHSHHDHVEGVAVLASKYGVPVYMHSEAVRRVDVGGGEVRLVKEGEGLSVGSGDGGGGVVIEVMETPGHIDDAVCYFCRDEGWVVTGDTLFVEGCGRADFPDSNVEDLWRSLGRLRELPDAVKVYPGHDYGSKPVSTIGWEKAHNKYLLCKDFEEFRRKRLGY